MTLLTGRSFDETGDFAAYRAAVRWLEEQGYSVGRMQRGAPCGVLRGEWDVQKWRNLSTADRKALDGTLFGNFRDGPVCVRPAESRLADACRTGAELGPGRSSKPTTSKSEGGE